VRLGTGKRASTFKNQCWKKFGRKRNLPTTERNSKIEAASPPERKD
jgi:hypothetical protein